MKAVVIAVCVLTVLAHQRHHVYAQCPSSSAQCTASAMLEIVEQQGVSGTCTGVAMANCTAFAETSKPCMLAMKQSLSEGKCRPKDIIIAAKCVSRAMATAMASAFVSIQCTGDARGCGFAVANANAMACNFANGLAEMQIQAGSPGDIDEAVCQSIAGASMGSVFASATASAQAVACSQGNEFVTAFESEFVRNVECSLAETIAKCWLGCHQQSLSKIFKFIPCGFSGRKHGPVNKQLP